MIVLYFTDLKFLEFIRTNYRKHQKKKKNELQSIFFGETNCFESQILRPINAECQFIRNDLRLFFDSK